MTKALLTNFSPEVTFPPRSRAEVLTVLRLYHKSRHGQFAGNLLGNRRFFFARQWKRNKTLVELNYVGGLQQLYTILFTWEYYNLWESEPWNQSVFFCLFGWFYPEKSYIMYSSYFFWALIRYWLIPEIVGFPYERDCYERGTLRIPNHRAPNQQLTISWNDPSSIYVIF